MSVDPGSAATVRACTPDDAGGLAALAARTFGLACPPSLTPANIAAFIATQLSEQCFRQYLADPGRQLLAAEDAGRLLGYTMAVTGDPYDPHVAALVTGRPTVELSKVYVDRAAHGTGIASALMESTLAWARGTGATSIWLATNIENARAQAFYAKHSFNVVGERTFTVGAQQAHDLVFVLQLSTATR